MVRDFYGRMGFEKISQDENGNTEWRLDLSTYEPHKPSIIINPD
jgi:predicted enzyme involved in methoxymalonyl-ACP biosynthesis